MADYDETYSFTTLSANSADFTWDGPDVDVLSAENTAGSWCWTDVGSTSGSTGPPSGVPCVYTETSSPVEVNDEFYMTLAAANEVDAGAYGIYVTFDTCTQGNTSAHLYFEAYNGSSWQPIDDWAGDAVTTFTSRGPYNFTSYENSDFSIRFRTVVAGTTYTNDMAVDEIRIYGDSKVSYELEGVTYNVSGSILGSCELFLFKDNQDNTITFVDYTTSNASTGAYSFTGLTDTDAQYLVRAWKDDSPHVFDVTDHVCQPAETPSVSYDLYLRSDSDKGETSPDNDLRLRSDTEKLTTDPLVTNADDEDFLDDETGINVVGINFGASQTGSADIEIGDNATYGSCVDIESQTVNSWSDTQINIDIVFGSSSLEYGSNWLYVTESGGTTSASYAINLYKANVVSNVSPSSFFNGVTGITVSGSDFGSSKGSSVLYLADQSDGGGTNVTQTTTDWSSTSIEFTCVQGGLSSGTVYVIVARNNAGLGDSGARFSNGYSTILLPPPKFRMKDSAYFNDGDSTTAQLTAPSSGSFSAGRMEEGTAEAPAKSLAADEYTEYEWCMEATTDAESSAQYEFRIKDETQAGEKLETYTVTPKVTIAA